MALWLEVSKTVHAVDSARQSEKAAVWSLHEVQKRAEAADAQCAQAQCSAAASAKQCSALTAALHEVGVVCTYKYIDAVV
jgi:hypothetical protein